MTLSTVDKLAAARLFASKRFPYFRVAITSLIPREVKGIGTFGVSANGVMIYDPECVEKWTVPQLATVYVHEIGHLLRGHAGRCEIRRADRTLYNVSADMELNDDLSRAGLRFPCRPCLPNDIGMADGLTAEEYYTEIDKRAIRVTIGAPGEPGEPKDQKKGKGGKQETSHWGTQVTAGKCGGAAGNPNPQEGDSQEKADGIEGRTDVDMERVRRQVAEAIRQGNTDKDCGTAPGSWERWAEEVLGSPKIPWRQKLARITRNAVAYRPGAIDYRFTSISRRQSGIGFGPGKPVLPALVSPVPRISVVVDTSGSMGDDELGEALREVRGVLMAVGGDIEFCSADADVQTLGRAYNWKQLPGKLKGGGGTDFRPAIAALCSGKKRPDVLLYFTDGYGTAPETPPACKVIWLLVGSNNRAPAPWGEVIRIGD